MFRVGIDARLYSQTGVGVYLRNLLHFIEKITNGEILFYVYLLPEDYDKVRFAKSNFIKKRIHSRWHTISEQVEFAKILYEDDLDLVHFTYFSYPVLYKKKYISTIHDATPFYFKTGKASTKSKFLYEIKYLAFKFVISQQVKHAQTIITPTNFVKKQLTDIYGERYANKIRPIYEGVDYELQQVQSSKFKVQSLLNQTFFIYVGNFYPHKNVERLIQAFKTVKTKAKLVLIGPNDYFANKLYRYIDITIRNRVIFYHNASKKDLVFFYKNALALIHPSLSEGFGLPIIEAAYFNLPIIASDIEVFRELLGKKYLAFDPLSIRDIEDKIKLFLSQKVNVDYSDILKKFSFERMTKETLKRYQEIIV